MPFSGMARSTALGSIFGGTATQHPLSPALCDPGCLQPPRCWALGHSQAHRWLSAHTESWQSSSRGPQLGARSRRGPHHPVVPPLLPEPARGLFPAPMRHSSLPGRNLRSLHGFSPGTFRVTSCWWRGNGAGGGPSTRKHQSRIYCDASGHQLSASSTKDKIPRDQLSDPVPTKNPGQELPPLWPATFFPTHGMDSRSHPRCCSHHALKPAPLPGPALPSCCPGRRRVLRDQAPLG